MAAAEATTETEVHRRLKSLLKKMEHQLECDNVKCAVFSRTVSYIVACALVFVYFLASVNVVSTTFPVLQQDLDVLNEESAHLSRIASRLQVHSFTSVSLHYDFFLGQD